MLIKQHIRRKKVASGGTTCSKEACKLPQQEIRWNYGILCSEAFTEKKKKRNDRRRRVTEHHLVKNLTHICGSIPVDTWRRFNFSSVTLIRRLVSTGYFGELFLSQNPGEEGGGQNDPPLTLKCARIMLVTFSTRI